MIVGEHPLKDVYRRLMWGPARALLEAGPPALELRVLAGGGALAAAMLPQKRALLSENLARAFPGLERPALDALASEAFGAHLANQYVSFCFERCDAHDRDTGEGHEGGSYSAPLEDPAAPSAHTLRSVG